MALRLSTGLVNRLAGSGTPHVITGSTISFTASTKNIADSANGFTNVTVGDNLVVSGSTSNDSMNFTVTALDETTTGASVTVAETVVDESAAAAITIVDTGYGSSFKDIFKNGVLEIYSGTRPSDANNAEAGDKLLRITVNSGAFTPGVATNGLTFNDAIGGVLAAPSDEIWSGLGLLDGTATWFRFYTNAYETGASTTSARFDGSCGVGSGDLRLSSTSILEGGTVTLDSVTYTFPRI